MNNIYHTAVITGSSGLVGGEFLKRFLNYHPKIDIFLGGRKSYLPVDGVSGNAHFFHLDLSREINLNLTAEIVFHIAGEKINNAQMWDVNFDGTRRLLEWSATHGVKRFVYLSSVGVYGAKKDSGLVKAGATKSPGNTYESSKSAAEDLVREKCSEYGMEYVILQPSNVIGWMDGKAYPLLGLMKMIKRGWFTYFGRKDACFNYVAVEDVASALVAATVPGAANRSFILNSPVTMQQFVGWIAQELGVAPPSHRLPAIIGRATALLADGLRHVTGRSIPFGRERYLELTNTTLYDGSPVCDVLGAVYPMGIELAVRQLVRRYKEEGLL